MISLISLGSTLMVPSPYAELVSPDFLTKNVSSLLSGSPSPGPVTTRRSSSGVDALVLEDGWNGVIAPFVYLQAHKCSGADENLNNSGLSVQLYLTDGHGLGKATTMENQRGFGVDGAMFYFTDKDHMVAFRIAAAIVAGKPGNTAAQKRQARG